MPLRNVIFRFVHIYLRIFACVRGNPHDSRSVCRVLEFRARVPETMILSPLFIFVHHTRFDKEGSRPDLRYIHSQTFDLEALYKYKQIWKPCTLAFSLSALLFSDILISPAAIIAIPERYIYIYLCVRTCSRYYTTPA